MESNIEISRTCVHCGNEFFVDGRKQNKNSFGRILCDDCFSKLTKEERIKIYTERARKNKSVLRICMNCEQPFLVEEKANATRKVLFCPECIKNLTPYQRKKVRMEKDPEFKQKCLEEKRASYRKNIKHVIWKRAKTRAIKHNLEFNIEESDIIIPEVCPLLNIPIILGEKDNYENTPSLDRIDNSKGYIKGNVWVISKKANSMKNSASFSELNNFCKNIKRYSLNITENESNELENKESLG